MFKKFTFALVLVAICLSLVSGAEADGRSSGGGSKSVSTMDLGSGR